VTSATFPLGRDSPVDISAHKGIDNGSYNESNDRGKVFQRADMDGYEHDFR
jgi:hypothetical protein